MTEPATQTLDVPGAVLTYDVRPADPIDRAGPAARRLAELAMSYYVLLYDVVEDYVERRSAFRAAHLQLARAAHERGELVMAGAIGEPVDGAVLLFEAPTHRSSNGSRTDPYVVEGLVTR